MVLEMQRQGRMGLRLLADLPGITNLVNAGRVRTEATEHRCTGGSAHGPLNIMPGKAHRLFTKGIHTGTLGSTVIAAHHGAQVVDANQQDILVGLFRRNQVEHQENK